jgi:hypothetical protein
MFLRRTERKKNGKTHSYWNVVENKRLDGGRVVQPACAVSRRPHLIPEPKAASLEIPTEGRGVWSYKTQISRSIITVLETVVEAIIDERDILPLL